MGVITGYPDDTSTTDSDKFLTSDSSGATKLTAATTLKDYVLADGNVTPEKLATGATVDTVATNESTSSTSYVNLATTGPSITLDVPSTGIVLISFSANVVNTAAGNYVGLALEMSGANSLTATDFATTTIIARIATSNQYQGVDRTILLTGLNAGSTTFTLKYKTNAGTAQARERSLSVIPLG